MNGPLLDLPLLSYFFEEDASRSLLVDGNMEAVGYAAWIARGGSTVSKQTGTPHTPTQCLRTTCPGGYAGARNTAAVIGGTFHYIGYLRGDGAGTSIPKVYDGGGVLLATGTNSNAWQLVDTYATAATPYLDLVSMSASGYVEFDDWLVNPLIVRTRNVGLLGGSVQLGDGVTPAHFPTMLRKGMRFAQVSSQYLLRTLAADIGPTDFTFFQVIRCSSALNGAAVTNYTLMSNYNYPTSGWVWRVGNGSAGVAGSLNWVAEDGIADRSLSSAAHVILPNAIQSVALTKVGGVLAIYVDGRQVIAPTAVINPSAYSAQIGIGGQAGATQGWNGDIFMTKVYPYALQPNQIRALHEQSMMLVNS